MKRKTLSQFIKDNRHELTAAIRNAVPNIKGIDNKEIKMWVLNDEGLYNWAKQDGVKNI